MEVNILAFIAILVPTVFLLIIYIKQSVKIIDSNEA